MNVLLASHPAWFAAAIMTAFGIGLCVGLAHFGLLRQIASLFVAGGSVLRLIVLNGLRFIATGGLLYLTAHVGALPLCAALLGILAARGLVMRGIGDAP